ncbi:hypothetical protein PIB30_015580 [Stylosanthes scabra]|uniref:Ribonuclease H1 N-terminal domain-containing protein n=1 Tax=Stylosanthes scabra TaxID=79078 RepID=A0ABU6Q6Z6_9FABA|nr:hypothetical protein [Stylosanthes scabra]
MGECYVVFVGKTPSIYSSWAAAAPHVVGHRHAIHQRYPTMEEGVRAWMEFFHVSDGGFGSAIGAPDVKPDLEAPSGSGSKSRIAKSVSRALALDEPLGCESKSGASVTAPVGVRITAAEASTQSDGLGGDNDGSTISSVMAAVQAVEGRVSQLEVDKWELLMQMAHVMEQMAGLLTKDVKK